MWKLRVIGLIIKLTFLFISMISFNGIANVTVNDCIGIHGDVGIAMLLSMKEDFNLDNSAFIDVNTRIKIISEEPVTFALAKTYGLQEKNLSGENSEDSTTVDEYAMGFMTNNAKNVIAEYTFENKNKLQNISLTSAFVSDTDCIVRFNGYIIVKREF